jgi:hypothetical protein
VRDAPMLVRSREALGAAGIRCRAFHDEDLGEQVTAVATEPICGSARRFFRKYQLLNGND